MRLSRQKAQRREKAVTVMASALAGIGALALSALIMSAAASLLDMTAAQINAMSGIALAAGCFACAYCAANRRRRGGFYCGLCCGVCVFIIAVIACALTVRIFSAQGIFIKLLIILSASAIGGIKGVNARPFFRK